MDGLIDGGGGGSIHEMMLICTKPNPIPHPLYFFSLFASLIFKHECRFPSKHIMFFLGSTPKQRNWDMVSDVLQVHISESLIKYVFKF